MAARGGPSTREAGLLDAEASRTYTGPVKRKLEEFGQSPDPYSPPSYRGVLLALVLIIGAVALLWYAFAMASP